MAEPALFPERGRSLGRWATIALVAIAAIRCTISIVPQVRFDVDPASNPEGYAGVGPAGSMLLDVGLLAACVLALAAERLAGRRVATWAVVLAALPSLAIIYHGAGNALDLFRGTTWLAAACAGVAAAHRARDPVDRRLLVAGVLAVAAPLLVRGIEQVTVEHAQTVEFFEKNKAAMFADRGWAEGTPAAEMFERRLRQVEATGWFGLANLYSAVMAFAAVGFSGLAAVALGRRESRGPAGVLCAILGLAALVLVGLNGSKGALVATALGAAIAVLASTTRGRRLAPYAAVAFVLLAAAAPVVRGFLPEAWHGEKSLLFRSQYLEGAIRSVPEAIPLGLGPDGFQAAYLRHKPTRSPEDVTSAHAMAVDWLILLGPLALAWLVLVGRFLLPRPAGPSIEPSPAEEGLGDPAIRAAVLVSLAVFAVQSVVEEPIADLVWVGSRGVAAVALGIAFVGADRALRAVGDRWWPVLFGALVAVMAQAQIEMIFFQPGLPAWAFLALGAIGGPLLASRARKDEEHPHHWLDTIPVALPGALALVVIGLGVVPQMRQDMAMDRAAELVTPLAAVREMWSGGMAQEVAAGKKGPKTEAVQAIVHRYGGVELEAGLRSALSAGDSAQARVAAVGKALQRFDAGQRARAADELRVADEIYPANQAAIEAAIKQLAIAGRRTFGARRAEIVDPVLHAAAIDLAAEHATVHDTARAWAMLSDLWLERVRAQSDEATVGVALGSLDRMLERQPRAAARHADRGDLLAAKGDFAAAAEAYRRALAIDADLELDPLAQFDPRLKASVEERLRTAEAASRGEAPPPHGWPFNR